MWTTIMVKPNLRTTLLSRNETFMPCSSTSHFGYSLTYLQREYVYDKCFVQTDERTKKDKTDRSRSCTHFALYSQRRAVNKIVVCWCVSAVMVSAGAQHTVAMVNWTPLLSLLPALPKYRPNCCLPKETVVTIWRRRNDDAVDNFTDWFVCN